MNAIVIEHVPVAELPPAWRAQLASGAEARVTVRIEEEAAPAAAPEAFVTDDPAFGIWRDRQDMADVRHTSGAFGRRASTATARATGLDALMSSVLVDTDVLIWHLRG